MHFAACILALRNAFDRPHQARRRPDVRIGQKARPLSQLAKVTGSIIGASIWAITQSCLREFKRMNVAADSAQELGCPF